MSLAVVEVYSEPGVVAWKGVKAKIRLTWNGLLSLWCLPVSALSIPPGGLV